MAAAEIGEVAWAMPFRSTVAALFSAMERRDSNGPCHFEGGGRFDAVECFQTARGASSLVARRPGHERATRCRAAGRPGFEAGWRDWAPWWLQGPMPVPARPPVGDIAGGTARA